MSLLKTLFENVFPIYISGLILKNFLSNSQIIDYIKK